jgi:hypothetical protein
MAVTIDHTSARFTVTGQPKSILPTQDDDTFVFKCDPFTAKGSVRLTGELDDDPTGWEFGVIQVEFVETNWLYYRGQTNSDGSLLLQRGKPPARLFQACRDTQGVDFGDGLPVWAEPGNIIVPAAGDSVPLVLELETTDAPHDNCQMVEVNSRTGKDNFLREAQLEFHFCTILALCDPDGDFHQLASVYWNVRWQARFQPTDFDEPETALWTITPIPGGNGAGASGVIRGPVTDPRFRDLVTGPADSSCPEIAELARKRVKSGAGRRESLVWETFDVRY